MYSTVVQARNQASLPSSVPKAEETGFTHLRADVGDVVGEIFRRAELRPALEAEPGGPISDEEFLRIADATGMKL
jgi:hypothetical protein